MLALDANLLCFSLFLVSVGGGVMGEKKVEEDKEKNRG